jgi:hypothetical protein
MVSSKIGPVLAVCTASVAVTGCLALPLGGHSPKFTAVHTASTPASKIDLYYSAAVRSIEARDYAQALDYLQTARGLAQDDVRVINAFGVVYDKLGRFDLSRRYYAEAKVLDPTSKVVDNNLAYSERLQGLAEHPLAFASAAEAEAKLQPKDGLMPGSPVVVVPIASGPAPVVEVATIAPMDAAPELFKPAHRTQLAAAQARVPRGTSAKDGAVRPAATEVGRVQLAAAKPAETPAEAPKAAAAPAKASARLAGAPIMLVDASGSPDAVLRISKRLAGLGWSVQAAPAALHAKTVDATRIDYPARTPQIAQALARTLRGSVAVHVCAHDCPAIRLVVGKDARNWTLPKKVVSKS